MILVGIWAWTDLEVRRLQVGRFIIINAISLVKPSVPAQPASPTLIFCTEALPLNVACFSITPVHSSYEEVPYPYTG